MVENSKSFFPQACPERMLTFLGVPGAWHIVKPNCDWVWLVPDLAYLHWGMLMF